MQNTDLGTSGTVSRGNIWEKPKRMIRVLIGQNWRRGISDGGII